jgi:hypothetical protein
MKAAQLLFLGGSGNACEGSTINGQPLTCLGTPGWGPPGMGPLQESLAIAELQQGGSIAMAGGRIGIKFREAAALAAKYGGREGDWVYFTSAETKAIGNALYQAHWAENVRTGQRAMEKLKLVRVLPNQ